MEQEKRSREELLKIIDEAARDRRNRLDLSGRRISELPDEIGQCTNLRWLSLSANNLKSLPETLDKLAKLETLGIRKTD